MINIKSVNDEIDRLKKVKRNENLKEYGTATLSPPWITYYNEILKLFGDDPDVSAVTYNNVTHTINMYIDNAEKAYAIMRLLPTSKDFGKVVLKINVIPSNNIVDSLELFKKAFEGNPVFSFTKESSLPSAPFKFVVFKNKVVQFYNDNLQDINGNKTTLYEEIARDVFGENNKGIYFCTDESENAE